MQRRARLNLLLVDMERGLRVLDLWEVAPPEPERLASAIPFCHDTLEFTQWLQWVFIPRMRAVLEGGRPLPADCSIAPIAEDAFARIDGDTDALLDGLLEIDRLLSTRGAALTGDLPAGTGLRSGLE